MREMYLDNNDGLDSSIAIKITDKLVAALLYIYSKQAQCHQVKNMVLKSQ